MGTTMGYTNIHFMTWLQKRIPESLMGRVMSLIMFASVGVAPLSNTLAGAILNINLTLLFVGAGLLISAIAPFTARRPTMRQMGLEAATSEPAEPAYSEGTSPKLRTTSTMPAVHS